MEQTSPILVLVTLQRACARLIRRGADMALQQHCILHVLHVVENDPQAVKEWTIDAHALDYLYALAGEAGAQMTVLKAEVALTAVAEFARREGIRRIIMGGGEHAEGIAQTLSELLPGVQIMILSEEE